MTENQHILACIDGLAIEFQFNSTEVAELLNFLFLDLPEQGNERVIARFVFTRLQTGWELNLLDGSFKMTHAELIELSLPLLNYIMRILADNNTRSISLHAGLLSRPGGSILLPGAPGSGKSNACLWMAHLGWHYHSDEMVTINREDMSLTALTRPFTLRREALQRLQGQIKLASHHEGIRISELNCWIAHRLINADYQVNIPPLNAAVFPVFTTGDLCQLTEISRAHAGMELMRSHFQSQSFEDHGFSTITRLIRERPSYILVYNQFSQIEALLKQLPEPPGGRDDE